MVETTANGNGIESALLAFQEMFQAQRAEMAEMRGMLQVATERKARNRVRSDSASEPLQAAVAVAEFKGHKTVCWGVRGGGGPPANFTVGLRKLAGILATMDRVVELLKAEGISVPVAEDVSLRLSPGEIAPRRSEAAA